MERQEQLKANCPKDLVAIIEDCFRPILEPLATTQHFRGFCTGKCSIGDLVVRNDNGTCSPYKSEHYVENIRWGCEIIEVLDGEFVAKHEEGYNVTCNMTFPLEIIKEEERQYIKVGVMFYYYPNHPIKTIEFIFNSDPDPVATAKAADEKAKEFSEMIKSHSLDQLAHEQGVKPMTDVHELFGTWPGKPDDDFEDDILKQRQGER